MPVLPTAYSPIDSHEAEAQRQVKRDRQRDEQGTTSKSLRRISVQELVRVQHPKTGCWDQYAVVERVHQHGRTYLLRLNNGKTYFRNRLHLRPVEPLR